MPKAGCRGLRQPANQGVRTADRRDLGLLAIKARWHQCRLPRWAERRGAHVRLPVNPSSSSCSTGTGNTGSSPLGYASCPSEYTPCGTRGRTLSTGQGHAGRADPGVPNKCGIPHQQPPLRAPAGRGPDLRCPPPRAPGGRGPGLRFPYPRAPGHRGPDRRLRSLASEACRCQADWGPLRGVARLCWASRGGSAAGA